jgi:peptide/nickel transport system permease protein
MGYLVRRALHAGFLLFGVSLLVFALVAIAPGDFYSELQLDPSIRSQSIEALRSEYGVDRPVYERYARWVGGMLGGDWGVSLAYHVPVWPLLRERARNTLLITVSATILAWLLALLLGIWAATSRRRMVRGFVGAASSAVLATPELFVCLLLLVFALRTGVFPVGGMSGLESVALGTLGRWRDAVEHMVLPVIALTITALPVLVWHVRSAVQGALVSPAIQTARASGIARSRILLRHALPLTANPLVTLLGLSVATLLSGSLVVEVVMGWPGLGPLLLESILARDLFVVIGIVMLSALLLVAGNFLGDTLLFALDPRTREGQR